VYGRPAVHYGVFTKQDDLSGSDGSHSGHIYPWGLK
jgi:hypothetical protein